MRVYGRHRSRPGKTRENVAEYLGISHTLVQSVLTEFKELKEKATAEGGDEADVKFPMVVDTRNRTPKKKDRHYQFIERCLTMMVNDLDLDRVPSR